MSRQATPQSPLGIEHQSEADVSGIAARVIRPRVLVDTPGAECISATLVRMDDGATRVVITIRHKDGAMLSCLLDDPAFDRFADQLGGVVEAQLALGVASQLERVTMQ